MRRRGALALDTHGDAAGGGAGGPAHRGGHRQLARGLALPRGPLRALPRWGAARGPWVDPTWLQRLELKCDTLLSNVAFNLKLRPSTWASWATLTPRPPPCCWRQGTVWDAVWGGRGPACHSTFSSSALNFSSCCTPAETSQAIPLHSYAFSAQLKMFLCIPVTTLSSCFQPL